MNHPPCRQLTVYGWIMLYQLGPLSLRKVMDAVIQSLILRLKTKSSGEAERSRFWQIDQNTFWQVLTTCVLYDLFVLHFFWDKLWWFPAEVLVWGGNSCRDFSSWCQKAQRREPICWTSKLQMQHVFDTLHGMGFYSKQWIYFGKIFWGFLEF